MSVKAPEAPHCQLEVAALDPYRLAVEKGIRHLPPRRFQCATECSAGNTHALGAPLLLQPLQVLEAYRLSLINGKTDLLKSPPGNPFRLEVGYLGYGGNTTPV